VDDTRVEGAKAKSKRGLFRFLTWYRIILREFFKTVLGLAAWQRSGDDLKCRADGLMLLEPIIEFMHCTYV
jgi:hypothetical protein